MFAFWTFDELLGVGERGIWGKFDLKLASGCLLLTRLWRIFWGLKLFFGAIKNGFVGLFETDWDIAYLGGLCFFSKAKGFVLNAASALAGGVYTFWISFEDCKISFF